MLSRRGGRDHRFAPSLKPSIPSPSEDTGASGPSRDVALYECRELVRSERAAHAKDDARRLQKPPGDLIRTTLSPYGLAPTPAFVPLIIIVRPARPASRLSPLLRPAKCLNGLGTKNCHKGGPMLQTSLRIARFMPSVGLRLEIAEWR
jgi:hypothetical protein